MRKAKWNVLTLATALVLTFLCAQATAAPRPQKQNQPEHAAKNDEEPQKVEVYRMAYVIKEMQNGKTINARSYTLMARTHVRASTRIATDVGFSVSPSNVRAIRVSMNTDCLVTAREGNLLLVHTEISMETIAGKETIPSESIPLVRHLSLSDDTVATLGKPSFVGAIDDVASNRRYVVEVTVTKAM